MSGGAGKQIKPAEPKMDRMFPNVVAPPIHPMMLEELFDKGITGPPNLAVLKEHLLKEGRLHPDLAFELISRASALLRAEPNLLELQYPLTVCGDVHGQFFDLVRLIEVGGDPKDTQYLFLGDYVDRGCFSTEVVFYLYAHKIMYPRTLFMLRGNHECRQLTSFFNFKDECSYKYSPAMYDAIMASFDNLPLAATVNNSFFCVHGGLSPDLNSLREIHDLDRFSEVPREGPMCDLLWSDPYEDEADEERENENDEASQSAFFGYNETRQCSYVFGVEAVKQFLTDNKLTSIIRAHEAQVDGYKMHMVNKQSGIPRVITIFSAPNYCDVYKNKAACLKFDSNVLNIKQFIDSPHPYYLPNFMDVFQWSLPFVAEKVTDMLANILDFDDDDMEPEPPKIIVKAEPPKPKQIVDKSEKKNDPPAVAIVVKAPEGKPIETKEDPLKVAIENLAKKNKELREQNESVAALKQLTRNNTVPAGLMQESPKSIADAIGSFEGALIYDEVNEHRPGQQRKKRGDRFDPRRDSLSSKASRAERLKEKRNSLPTSHLKEMVAPGSKNRRHVRNVKSEDLSRWAPATLAEPAFALTSADEPEDKTEQKTEQKK